MILVLNISTDYICGDFVSNTTNKVAIVPQLPRPKLLPQLGKFLEHLTPRYTFHYLHYFGWRISRRCFQKYVHMVFHHLHGIYSKFIFVSYPLENLFQIPRNFLSQYALPILRYPYQMILQIIYGVFSPSYTHASVITVGILLWQTLPRLTASHFHPASKLTGIQWNSL